MEHVISPSGCVHALPGRLRVMLAAIKKAPAVASGRCSPGAGIRDEAFIPITDAAFLTSSAVFPHPWPPSGGRTLALAHLFTPIRTPDPGARSAGRPTRARATRAAAAGAFPGGI